MAKAPERYQAGTPEMDAASRRVILSGSEIKLSP